MTSTVILPNSANSLPTTAAAIAAQFNAINTLIPSGNADQDAYYVRQLKALVSLWQQQNESNAMYAFRIPMDVDAVSSSFSNTFLATLCSAIQTDTGTQVTGAAAFASAAATRSFRGAFTPAVGALYPTTGGSGNAGAIQAGDSWVISGLTSAGIAAAGTSVYNGDLLFAVVNAPGTTASNWAVAEHEFGFTPAHAGANSDITSITGLTTALAINQGGTGGITAAAALNNLGGFPVTYSGAGADANVQYVTGRYVSSGASALTHAPNGFANTFWVLDVAASSTNTGGSILVSQWYWDDTVSHVYYRSGSNGGSGTTFTWTNWLTATAVFGASGANHTIGQVPDPGSSAGTTHFLREDATWATLPFDTSAGDFVANGTPAAGSTGKIADAGHVHPSDPTKQALLVSGTNIKTVGGNTLLGPGDVPLMDGATETSVLDAGLVSGNATVDRTSVPGQTILKYLTPGASTFTVPTGVTSLWLLTVGGGGGSGNGATGHGSGGGGGGRYVENNQVAVTPGASYTITVGAGGAANTQGGTSSVGSLMIATGGGAGGNATSGGSAGGAGGSGGGGGSPGQQAGGAAAAGTSTGGGGTVTNNAATGYGNAGQQGLVGIFEIGGAGGGAGDGGNFGVSPGNGLQSSITGTATYYAGGGGGGLSTGANESGSNGGTQSALPGAANTGAGAGGISNSNNSGLAGGSGIVVIRYATQTRIYPALTSYSSDTTALAGGLLVGQFYQDSNTGAVRAVQSPTDASTGVSSSNFATVSIGRAFDGCKVSLSAGISIASGNAIVGWTSHVYDTASYHSDSTNNSRMTAPRTGYYELNCRFEWAAANAGLRGISYRINGGADNWSITQAATQGDNTRYGFTTPLHLNAGDYVEINAYQNSGGALNLDSAPNTFAALTWLGQ